MISLAETRVTLNGVVTPFSTTPKNIKIGDGSLSFKKLRKTSSSRNMVRLINQKTTDWK